MGTVSPRAQLHGVWARRLSPAISHPGVADVAVIPRPDERTGEIPVAVVVPRGTPAPDELIGWVAARVAPHKRIRAVRLTGRIPRAPAGKILRRALIEQDRSAASGATDLSPAPGARR
jgi:acyl-CoA synthetase (AMP-forming)/AMP-acid ligase II